MLRQLAYCSSCTSQKEPPPEFIEGILETSRRNNAENGVTGVLLFKSLCFFQLLEAEEKVLADTLYRIVRDPRHTFLTIIYDVEIKKRDFSCWDLGFRTPDHCRYAQFNTELNRANFDFSTYMENPKGFTQELSNRVGHILHTFEHIM